MCMQDVQRKIFKAVKLVVNICAARTATRKAYMLLPNHCRLCRSEVDRIWFGDSLEPVVVQFAGPVLKEERDTEGEELGWDAVENLVMALQGVSMQRRWMAWDVQPSQSPTQKIH